MRKGLLREPFWGLFRGEPFAAPGGSRGEGLLRGGGPELHHSLSDVMGRRMCDWPEPLTSWEAGEVIGESLCVTWE
ncbi:hypothetical protein E2C01_062104 [Portunus trituberculatus]|uniref:Uncharacterized protein n=1 Tax=Portunus trituberculatus TaxID=210409 RepID=A0A5B7HG68_PORTR|nr:hypothetical protein [Portunus trituberculatus]